MSVSQMSTKSIQKLFKTICLEVGSAQKNGSGNFKNKYATLEEIQETLAIVLEKHKCYVSTKIKQGTGTFENGVYTGIMIFEFGSIEVDEILTHEFDIVASNTRYEFALGGATTYGQRYFLKNLFGIIINNEDSDPESTKYNNKMAIEVPFQQTFNTDKLPQTVIDKLVNNFKDTITITKTQFNALYKMETINNEKTIVKRENVQS